METKETIIFEVDVTSYEKSLALLSNSINALKADQKAYLEDSKKGIAGAAEAYEKVTVQLKNQQQAYRTTQAALQGYVAGQKSGVQTANLLNNSIQQNRDLLKQLTAQYINTKNPSEAFTKQIKAVSDALKQQESAIGDTRRNVGNYADGFVKAFGELQLDSVKLGAVIDPIKNITSGFKEAGGGVAGFQAALLGAVPLVIGGIEGMVSISQKFDDVVEGLEDTFAGASMAFDYFVSQGNSGSFTDLIDNLEKAYEAGVALSSEMRYLGEITDLQRVTNARNAKDVDQLIIQSKDRTKGERERLELLDIASAKEKKNLEQNLSLAERRKNIAAEELKRVIEQGLNNDKQLKERNDSEVAYIELQRESQNLQEKIINRRNQLLQEEEAKRLKLEEERLKKFAKLRQDELKSLEDTLAKEQELKDKAYEDETTRELNALVRREELLAEQTANPEVLIEAITLRRNLLLENEQLTETERQNIITESELKILGIKKQAADRDIKIAEDTAKTKQGIQQAELNFASGVSSALIGFIGDVADASGAGAEFQKVLAGIEIGVKTAVALAGAIAQAQSVPFPANLAAIGAGIAAVLGGVASAVGLLRKTPDVPKFAKGVIGLDGEGTETSDSVPAMLSRGESVVTAKATKKYHRELAWMEQSVGNTPNYKFGSGKFANGLIGGISTNAGFDTREIATSALQRAEMTFAIKEAMLSAPAPIVSVKEFNRVNSGVQRSVRVSEV